MFGFSQLSFFWALIHMTREFPSVRKFVKIISMRFILLVIFMNSTHSVKMNIEVQNITSKSNSRYYKNQYRFENLRNDSVIINTTVRILRKIESQILSRTSLGEFIMIFSIFS